MDGANMYHSSFDKGVGGWIVIELQLTNKLSIYISIVLQVDDFRVTTAMIFSHATKGDGVASASASMDAYHTVLLYKIIYCCAVLLGLPTDSRHSGTILQAGVALLKLNINH